jgi:hypothetical protein
MKVHPSSPLAITPPATMVPATVPTQNSVFTNSCAARNGKEERIHREKKTRNSGEYFVTSELGCGERPEGPS